MGTKKKKLNRKNLTEKVESIERLLASPNHLTDTQARKFALVEVREMLELLKGVPEERPTEFAQQRVSDNGQTEKQAV